MPKRGRPLHLVTIVGARPQFIKCAPFSRVWRKHHRETLVHTGQHYDADMSDVFFRELGIPKPDHDLGIGGGSHGVQTGRMLAALDALLAKVRPDGVLVYGDTNSTLAGALAASKLSIPVFHVEAGLRSFRRSMPEEINRVATDHVSDLLFAPTDAAVKNLKREGIRRGIVRVGDIMFDAYKHFLPLALKRPIPLPTDRPFALATIHRAESTADAATLTRLLEALSRLPIRVLWPVHPRTRAAMKAFSVAPGPNVTMIPPVGYLDCLRLEKAAALILTDSGGVQKEAYFSRRPCITLRDETEWGDTVTSGANRLVGSDPKRIYRAVTGALSRPPRRWPPLFGRGDSAVQTAQAIVSFLRANLG